MSRTCHSVGFLFALTLFLVPRALFARSNGFAENQGQVDARVLYYAQGSPASVYFTPGAIVFDIREDMTLTSPAFRPGAKNAGPTDPAARGCAVYVRFEGANPSPAVEARGELPGRTNYFFGSDPTQWRSNVRSYAEVVYHDLWPGIDLTWREDAGQLVYALTCRPGADPRAVRFTYEGADQVVPGDGSILIRTSAGTLADLRPASGGEGRFALSLETRDGDPGLPDNPSILLWSTLLGGAWGDKVYGGATGANGSTVTGATSSADFPTTPGAYEGTLGGGFDVFVSRLSPDGNDLVWSTYVGGSGNEDGLGMALDSHDNAIVTGQTASPSFPTTEGAYDRTHNGSWDAFAFCLDPTGSNLLWSTFLGGSGNDYGTSVAIDPMDNPLVGGESLSPNYPTTPEAYDPTANGDMDIVLTRLSSTGSTLLWSTYLGGASVDCIDLNGGATVFDSQGNLILAGYTSSEDFPTTPGAYDQTKGVSFDGCVAKISAAGSALVWSTFLGGDPGDDACFGLTLDPAENVIVTGQSWSHDFPTTPGAYDQVFEGSADGYVARISSDGSALEWSTLLGGGAADGGQSVCLDASGNVIVLGATRSMNFPTTPNGYDLSYNGDLDAFVCQLSSTGSTLIHSSYLGGQGTDTPYRVCLAPSGSVVLSGSTTSMDFPTTPGAFDESRAGATDGFVAMMELPPPASVPVPPEAGSITLWAVSANPFSQATNLLYRLTRDAEVSLEVLDLAGRHVTTLHSGTATAGLHQVTWDGLDAHGNPVGAGVYLVRMEADGASRVVKVARVR